MPTEKQLNPDMLKKKDLLVTTLILLMSALVHGVNMFNFPYYENDEGVYLSQALYFAQNGQLGPYTYWYDHAPVGWIFTSLWLRLTGDIFTFGFSLNSGRVFMLLVKVLSTFLIIDIVKKVTDKKFPAYIAGIIFSLSPLGIYFHRRLLLDNIMTFFVLLSFRLILGKALALRRYVLSGISFGLAVLTKENAVFFLPAFGFLVYKGSNLYHKNFALLKWLVAFFIIASFYPLYALLKGEFFPASLINTRPNRVSLFDTLSYQLSRDGGSIFSPQESMFWHNMELWIIQDPLITVFGLGANLILLVYGIKIRNIALSSFSMMGMMFWFFLARGGLVLEFYVVPLIPLLAAYIGLTFYYGGQILQSQKVIKNKKFYYSFILIFTAIYFLHYTPVSQAFNQFNAGRNMFTTKQTAGQKQAVEWIKQEISEDAVIIFDNYAYIELKYPKNDSDKVFPRSHWYWKVDSDPEIKQDILGGSPRSIDFIAKTPQMNDDLKKGVSVLTSRALQNSRMIKTFDTLGWGVEIWATVYPKKILERSWTFYKKMFITKDGRVVDPDGNVTTSEGQSYAMLRSVWLDDRVTFDLAWNWTKQNLMKEDSTFSWKWQEGEIKDSASAADADVDIALSLIFASRVWDDQRYLNQALDILEGIWLQEVRIFNGEYYPLPGNWALSRPTPIVNPSYIAPYAYKIFASVDKRYDWYALAESSYGILEKCIKANFQAGNEYYLPPNWCSFDVQGNPVRPYEPGLNTDYSYDAVRTMWRLALDYRWYQDKRSRELLELSYNFLKDKWQNEKKILVAYNRSGDGLVEFDTALSYATNIANFVVNNPEIADDIYKNGLLSKYYEDFEKDLYYWEDPKNYYLQNWAWFGTALYANQLPNLYFLK